MKLTERIFDAFFVAIRQVEYEKETLFKRLGGIAEVLDHPESSALINEMLP